jgi:hypothetical protein
MRKLLRCQKRILIVFVGSFLTIAFLVFPAMSAEITPAEKLQKAEELSIRASEMAAQAEDAGDAELAKKALELAIKASRLVSEVVSEAQRTGNTDLAQKAINMAVRVGAAITRVKTAGIYIARTSTDPKVVADAKKVVEKAEGLDRLNNETIWIALATPGTRPPEGYVPPEVPGREIPVQEEPPIQDTEPASPV